MRMWMVDPRIMCRKHLLGEHVELHMLLGTINKGVSIQGYVDNDLVEPAFMHRRHGALVAEMESRGYNHKSDLPKRTGRIPDNLFFHKIDRDAALAELLSRCPACKARHAALELDRLIFQA